MHRRSPERATVYVSWSHIKLTGWTPRVLTTVRPSPHSSFCTLEEAPAPFHECQLRRAVFDGVQVVVQGSSEIIPVTVLQCRRRRYVCRKQQVITLRACYPLCGVKQAKCLAYAVGKKGE